MTAAAEPPPLSRRQLYALLIVLAAAVTLGRILSVPFIYGDNDASRWLTAEALSSYGAYHIGERIEYSSGEHIDRGILIGKDGKFRSNDIVLNPTPVWESKEARGSVPVSLKRFYSSKPTLLPTLMGNFARLLRSTGGWTLEGDQLTVVRLGLIVFNWIPFVLMLAALASLIERLGAGDWARLFALAAAGFATFATTFQTTINNHTLATASICCALFCLLQEGGPTQLREALNGFWAGFAAANELPALAFVGLVALDLLLRKEWRLLPAFLVAAAVPVAAQAGLTWLAMGIWLPAYAEFGTAWYEFPGSYWSAPKGIDLLAEPRFVYFCHLTVGHHGLFSLTPIFLFGLVGMLQAWLPKAGINPELKRLGRLSLALSAVVIVFYGFVTKTQNYGGWTAGPRWLMWLSPFFLLMMLSWLDAAAGTPWRRRLALGALGWSVFSAFAVVLNPWVHPWIFRILHWLGLVGY